MDRHILPALGTTRLRALGPQHLETLYRRMLQPDEGQRALAPKTVYEVHLIIRGALNDAVRRGLVNRWRSWHTSPASDRSPRSSNEPGPARN